MTKRLTFPPPSLLQRHIMAARAPRAFIVTIPQIVAATDPLPAVGVHPGQAALHNHCVTLVPLAGQNLVPRAAIFITEKQYQGDQFFLANEAAHVAAAAAVAALPALATPGAKAAAARASYTASVAVGAAAGAAPANVPAAFQDDNFSLAMTWAWMKRLGHASNSNLMPLVGPRSIIFVRPLGAATFTAIGCADSGFVPATRVGIAAMFGRLHRVADREYFWRIEKPAPAAGFPLGGRVLNAAGAAGGSAYQQALDWAGATRRRANGQPGIGAAWQGHGVVPVSIP